MVTRAKKKRERQHLYIAEWMDFLGLTDEALGNRMGKDRATIWRWRVQQHRLNPDKIAALAAGIGLADPVDLWRDPRTARPSLDAIIKNAPGDIQDMAADIIRRLVTKR
jgi:hypothetical protein